MWAMESLPSGFNITLMYAVVWTINNHYASDSSKPLTIIHFATRDASRGLHNDLIDAVLGLASSAGRIKFLLQSERFEANDTYKPDDPKLKSSDSNTLNTQTTAIWLLDSIWAYLRLERRLMHPDSTFKRNGFYCIVYTGQEADRLSTIREIFRRLFSIYVINVNVFLEQRESGMVQIYNYYPYRSKLCQSSLPIHYATFRGGFGAAPLIHVDDRTQFFDDKLDNMHGCPLVVVTFQHRPFVIIQPDDSLVPPGKQLAGIEGMLCRLLADRMNFTIQLIEEPNQDRGTVLPNGTVTGAMGMVFYGQANITFVSFMYSKDRAKYMLPTITYTSFPILLLVPGGLRLSPLQRLTKPLATITWLWVLASVSMGFAVIGLLQLLVAVPHVRHFVLGMPNRWPCLALWSTLLGNLHTQPPHRNFARYLLALWLFETLILRAAYSGELYILLQDGRMQTPLRSLAEVMQQDYLFKMQPSMQNIVQDLLPITRIRAIVKLDATLEQLRDEENVRFVVPLLQPNAARFDMESGPLKPRLRYLPDPLLTAPLTFYMRPHSYFKQRINNLFMNMMSSGMVHRCRRMYLDRIEHMVDRRRREPNKLSIWLLGGLFALFGVMQLLACSVFLLEFLAAAPRRTRLRRLMDALHRYVK